MRGLPGLQDASHHRLATDRCAPARTPGPAPGPPAHSEPRRACGWWWPVLLLVWLLPAAARGEQMQVWAAATPQVVRPGDPFKITVCAVQWDNREYRPADCEVVWPSWGQMGLSEPNSNRRHRTVRTWRRWVSAATTRTVGLTARTAGTLTISGIQVRAGGATALTAPITVVVDPRAPASVSVPDPPPAVPLAPPWAAIGRRAQPSASPPGGAPAGPRTKPAVLIGLIVLLALISSLVYRALRARAREVMDAGDTARPQAPPASHRP
jgi:hypothetical protein